MSEKEISKSLCYRNIFDSKSRIAFTLAEVLITICVIGVVAALTLPSLIHSYKNKIYSSQLQKTYSILSDAAKQVVIAENADQNILETTETVETGTPGFYTSDAGLIDSSKNTGAQYFLSNYIKHSKVGSEVMSNSYSTPNGNNLGKIPSDAFCVKTVAGAGVCMKYDKSANIAKLYVDVNGAEDPNESGIDLFVMQINDDSSISDIVEDESKCNSYSEGSNVVEKYAGGCLYKVMNAGWKIEE